MCSLPVKFSRPVFLLLILYSSATVHAGFLDDLKGLEKTVKDAMNRQKNQPAQPQPVPASRADNQGNITGHIQTNTINISLAAPHLRGGQFNVRPDDFGLFINLTNPVRQDGAANRCYQFVYERFGKQNDSSLNALRAQYSGMQGQKVMLENVRLVHNTCVFSRLRPVVATSAKSAKAVVTGQSQGASYGIPLMLKPGQQPKQVLIFQLKNISATGIRNNTCHSFFREIDAPRNSPQEAETIKASSHYGPGYATFKLYGVETSPLTGYCKFTRFEKVVSKKPAHVAGAASTMVSSGQHHIPQIRAALTESDHFTVKNRIRMMEREGYKLNERPTSRGSDIRAQSKDRYSSIGVEFDKNNNVRSVTSEVSIKTSEPRPDCDRIGKPVVEQMIRDLNLKVTNTTNQGRMVQFDYPGHTNGSIIIGNTAGYRCNINFKTTALAQSKKVSQPAQNQPVVLSNDPASLNATHEHLALIKGAFNGESPSALIAQTKQLQSKGYRIADQPARHRILARQRGHSNSFSFHYDARGRITKINSTVFGGAHERDCVGFNRPVIERMIRELGLTQVKSNSPGGHMTFAHGKRTGTINSGNDSALPGRCQITFVSYLR